MRKIFSRRFGHELLFLAVLLVLQFAARSSLADHYQVPTGSMIPSVDIGDHVIVDKLAYGVHLPFSEIEVLRFTQPRSGDVVVLTSPYNGITLLKRVIAVPHDQVSVHQGIISINGVEQAMSLHNEKTEEQLGNVRHTVSLNYGGGPDYGPITMGDDQYLVMGDNRGNSFDGRSFGLVHHADIHGRATHVVWHQSHFAWTQL